MEKYSAFRDRGQLCHCSIYLHVLIYNRLGHRALLSHPNSTRGICAAFPRLPLRCAHFLLGPHRPRLLLAPLMASHWLFWQEGRILVYAWCPWHLVD